MISKNDAILLLTDLSNKGIDTSAQIKKLVSSPNIDLDILKFINDSRPIDITIFYEKIRKSYNNKHSNLYINLVREEFKNADDILTTIASLNLQLLLFTKGMEFKDKQMFLRNARFGEINACMLNYSKTYDLVTCQKLLKLIKADIKVFDSIKGE